MSLAICLLAVFLSGCSMVTPGLFPESVERFEENFFQKPARNVIASVPVAGPALVGPPDWQFSAGGKEKVGSGQSSSVSLPASVVEAKPSGVTSDNGVKDLALAFNQKPETLKSSEELKSVELKSASLPSFPKGDIEISKQFAEFLISELEETIKVLSAKEMIIKPDSTAELWESGGLVSWFDLETSSSQADYYRLLGIPVSNNTRLTRTKSEFYQTTEAQRIELRNYLSGVLKNLREEVTWQLESNKIGISESSLP